MTITVHELKEADRNWAEGVFRKEWGGEFVVTRGKSYRVSDLEGFYACDEHGKRIGLLTYRIDGAECELVSLNAFTPFGGIGTKLLEAAKTAAVRQRCRRVWLITTNDNLDAIRFYQRRGFTLVAVHANALEVSRKLKPSIPMTGNFGIPLRDELEFEMRL